MNLLDDIVGQHGYIEQQQEGFYAVRVRTIAGNLTSEQMRTVVNLADRYGNGQLHITTRQSLEIHWVQKKHLPAIFQEIREAGLLTAVRGARVMTVIACPGKRLCKRGIVDTVRLADEMNALLVGQETAAKTKIAISGCPNSCAKPQINDIGLHGVVLPVVATGCRACQICRQSCPRKAITICHDQVQIDASLCSGCRNCIHNCPQQAFKGEVQGYVLYLGGKIGRQPLLGQRVFEVLDEQQAMSYIQAILKAYRQTGLKGERIGAVIERIGLENFQREILNHLSGI
jgi:dissimilatory sulfite reductase (desulfoviridin) alpha/beta subunit